MKKRLGLLLAVSAMALGLGGAFAMSTVNGGANKVEEAKAEAATGEYLLVFGIENNPGSEFLGKDHAFVWYWGEGVTSKAVEIKKVNGNDRIGYCMLPKDTTGFKYGRCKDSLPRDSYPADKFNESDNITLRNDRNFIKVTGWDNSYSYSGWKTIIPNGETVFFDASAITRYNWSDANAVPYMVAWLNNDFYYVTKGTSWNLMTRIGSEEKYYFTATSDMILDGIAFTRNDPSGSAAWGSVWTQTTDISVQYGFHPNYLTGLTNEPTSDGKENWSPKGYEDTANVYGDYFLNTVTCNNGVTPPSTTKWNEASNMYGTLSELVQYTLYSGTANESGKKYEQALARYDLIANKYGTSSYSNFIGRSTVSSGRILAFPFSVNSENYGSFIAVITSVLVATVAIGGYFLLKKKRI